MIFPNPKSKIRMFWWYVCLSVSLYSCYISTFVVNKRQYIYNDERQEERLSIWLWSLCVLLIHTERATEDSWDSLKWCRRETSYVEAVCQQETTVNLHTNRSMIKTSMVWNEHQLHTSRHLCQTNSPTAVHTECVIGARDKRTHNSQ